MYWEMAPLILAVVTMTPACFAQSQPTHPESKPNVAAASPQKDRREQRMAEWSQMLADMKAMDARLQAKVDAMNQARDSGRKAAIIGVLNEIAREHHEMITKMEAMESSPKAMRGEMKNSAMNSSSACPCAQSTQEPKSHMTDVQGKSRRPNS